VIDRLSAILGQDVSRETFEKLERFSDMLIRENERQNLISHNSVGDIWERHLIDGAQLVALGTGEGGWVDIGTGAGLPGVVIAILTGGPVTLVEPRRLRVEFLGEVVAQLGLERVNVVLGKADAVSGTFDMITARAVAKLDRLFEITHRLSHRRTRWIFPKGESAKSELDEARRNWQGSFRLVPSQTSPAAAIVVAEGVRPRGR
jgi:16S rRNA (guanine527-N7)-methyltransferase